MKLKFIFIALIALITGSLQQATAQGKGKGHHKQKKHYQSYQGNRYDGNYRNHYRNRNTTSYYRYRNNGYRNMPPGQAKKYYGQQSAKQFGPGQQKKRYYTNRNYDNRYYNKDNRYYQNYDNDNGLGSVIGALLGGF